MDEAALRPFREYHARIVEQGGSFAMNARHLVLDRNIREDLKRIAKIYEALGSPELKDSELQEALIVVAYRLHSLFTAFENIFSSIAKAFENQVFQESWHREVLQRMRLDLTPLRPAVIDAEVYEKLDELRRFRHLFLTNYGLDLDPLRLRVVLQRAQELKPLYRPQIERFLEFLRGVE
jgi:uncharacterized protein YutE (UPF0331/DUF86 family)